MPNKCTPKTIIRNEIRNTYYRYICRKSMREEARKWERKTKKQEDIKNFVYKLYITIA